jgi:hypothetical protein
VVIEGPLPISIGKKQTVRSTAILVGAVARDIIGDHL